MATFSKNTNRQPRGEIAARVIRSAKSLGIRRAVYSEGRYLGAACEDGR